MSNDTPEAGHSPDAGKMAPTAGQDSGEFAGHTPGPWHWVDPNTDEPINFSHDDPRLLPEYQATHIGIASLRSVAEKPCSIGGTLPTFLVETDDLLKADARLMAAAPELLRERNGLTSQLAQARGEFSKLEQEAALIQENRLYWKRTWEDCANNLAEATVQLDRLRAENEWALDVCRRIVKQWDEEETVWVGCVEDARAVLAKHAETQS